MNRKAQGEVITTVLIILLVLAAVVIVWQAVRSSVTKSTENLATGTACVGLDMAVVTAVPGNPGYITITRNAGGSDDAVAPIVLKNGQAVSLGPMDCGYPGVGARATLKQFESTNCNIAPLVRGDNVTVGGKLGDSACPSVSAPVTV